MNRIIKALKVALLIGSAVLVTGCGYAWQFKIEGGEPTQKKAESYNDRRAPKIPPGHMPPQVNAESGIPTDHPDTSHHLEIARGSDAKFLLVLI